MKYNNIRANMRRSGFFETYDTMQAYNRLLIIRSALHMIAVKVTIEAGGRGIKVKVQMISKIMRVGMEFYIKFNRAT